MSVPRRSESSTAYSRVCLLSKGGMGQVEIALRRGGSFERLYAIKRLHPQFRDEPEFLAMFKREARIAGLVRHVNVVSVLDVGEDERGPFLVMEYVEGLPLSGLLRHVRPRLPVQVALRIVHQVASGLQAAHELTDHEGQPMLIVHRDVSPHNILVGFDGSVRVTDFGIAKALDEYSGTSTGVLKGKSGYLSPEQLRFEEADQRADLFSLGVVLFESLTGKRLYRGQRAAWRILNEAAPHVQDQVPEISDAVAELADALLAKDPAARPSSAKEVVSALEKALAVLVIEEGLSSVGDFAKIQLADDLIKHKEWLAEQVTAHRDDAPKLSWLATETLVVLPRDEDVSTIMKRDRGQGPVIGEGAPSPPDGEVAPRVASSSRVGTAMLVFALVAASIAAFVATLGHDLFTDPASSPRTSSSKTSSPPPDEVDEGPPNVVSDEAPGETEATALVEPAPPGETAASEARQAGRAARRTRRGGRRGRARQRPGPGAGSGVPSLSWEEN